ncbi:MAG: hypothetical protein IKZ89_06395 [Bacteroidaceae bacterium]|nr:hypothetical protein [Bacteroidaceae bacterium]
MSTVTLQNLLDYLKSTLSSSNMLWLSERLQECAKEKDDQVLKPYTIEEIHSRIAQSELDSSQGRVYEFDDVIREIEEEFALEETH